jgi:UDP-N-acetylglucosamine 1-carboxyvinyltransferase
VETLESLIRRMNSYRRMYIKHCESVKGSIFISGAKNSALPLLAASLLTEELTLENFPFLLDTFYGLEILKRLGKDIEVDCRTHKVKVSGSVKDIKVPFEISSLFRGSVLFLGGLLGSSGRAKVSYPGGCAIGSRPIDQHLKFLEHIGASLEVEGGYIKAVLPKKPKNRNFTFDLITVTGTENALLTLAGIEGEFTLENVALEPEVEDLVNFLRKLGVHIETEGRTLNISSPGRGNLKKKLTYKVIPDRIEAGTYLVLGALLGEPLEVKDLEPNHLGVVIQKLTEAGAKLEVHGNSVKIWRAESLKPLHIETAPYPGFPTDMQAQFTAMLSVANGTSFIVENIFENRFQHTFELNRMGANIVIKGNTAIVNGVDKLHGAPVKATDLRASAALVLAGLIAEDETVIHDIQHLLRGYENMDKKLQKLGCEVYLTE